MLMETLQRETKYVCLPQGSKLDFFSIFREVWIFPNPIVKNVYKNALSKLASSKDSELLILVPTEHISRPSIAKEEKVM